jgi:hypothetical protein
MGMEDVQMEDVERAIVKVNQIIFNTFSRSMVSQNEMKTRFMSVKENRTIVNKLTKQLVDIAETNMKAVVAEVTAEQELEAELALQVEKEQFNRNKQEQPGKNMDTRMSQSDRVRMLVSEEAVKKAEEDFEERRRAFPDLPPMNKWHV